jgi:hypothetical protein
VWWPAPRGGDGKDACASARTGGGCSVAVGCGVQRRGGGANRPSRGVVGGAGRGRLVLLHCTQIDPPRAALSPRCPSPGHQPMLTSGPN